MQRAHVQIELTAARLALTVFNGRGDGVVVAHREHDLESGAARPGDGHGALTPILIGWVNELGVRGTEATLLYAAPGAVAGVFACPASAKASAAANAAALAVAELAGPGAEASTGRTQTVSIDQSGARAQRHTLAVTDAPASSAALCAWLAGAGLKPVRIMPLETPALVRTIRAVTAADATAGARAVLWIGPSGSVLAAGTGNGDLTRLQFVRRLTLGVESLVDALTRPLRVNTPAAAPPAVAGMESGGAAATPFDTVTLDRGTARALLTRVGIPAPGDEIDAALGLKGAAVLPVLQPVLQRLGIELKQTLRFGLSDEERQGVTLTVIGPGSAAPRLAEVLAQACGATATPSPSTPPSLPEAEALAQRVALGSITVGTMPPAMERAAALAGTRRALRVGLGAAAALVVIYAGFTHLALRQAERQLEAVTAEVASVTTVASIISDASESAARASAAEAHLRSVLGPTTPLGPLLAAIAAAAEGGVRLTSVECSRGDREGFICTIAGVYRPPPGAEQGDFAAVLRRFSDALAASPSVAEVRLGATSRTGSPGEADEGHRFDLALLLVDVPAADLVLVNSNPGAEPAPIVSESTR